MRKRLSSQSSGTRSWVSSSHPKTKHKMQAHKQKTSEWHLVFTSTNQGKHKVNDYSMSQRQGSDCQAISQPPILKPGALRNGHWWSRTRTSGIIRHNRSSGPLCYCLPLRVQNTMPNQDSIEQMLILRVTGEKPVPQF